MDDRLQTRRFASYRSRFPGSKKPISTIFIVSRIVIIVLEVGSFASLPSLSNSAPQSPAIPASPRSPFPHVPDGVVLSPHLKALISDLSRIQQSTSPKPPIPDGVDELALDYITAVEPTILQSSAVAKVEGYPTMEALMVADPPARRVTLDAATKHLTTQKDNILAVYALERALAQTFADSQEITSYLKTIQSLPQAQKAPQARIVARKLSKDLTASNKDLIVTNDANDANDEINVFSQPFLSPQWHSIEDVWVRLEARIVNWDFLAGSPRSLSTVAAYRGALQQRAQSKLQARWQQVRWGNAASVRQYASDRIQAMIEGSKPERVRRLRELFEHLSQTAPAAHDRIAAVRSERAKLLLERVEFLLPRLYLERQELAAEFEQLRIKKTGLDEGHVQINMELISLETVLQQIDADESAWRKRSDTISQKKTRNNVDKQELVTKEAQYTERRTKLLNSLDNLRPEQLAMVQSMRSQLEALGMELNAFRANLRVQQANYRAEYAILLHEREQLQIRKMEFITKRIKLQTRVQSNNIDRLLVKRTLQVNRNRADGNNLDCATLKANVAALP